MVNQYKWHILSHHHHLITHRIDLFRMFDRIIIEQNIRLSIKLYSWINYVLVSTIEQLQAS